MKIADGFGLVLFGHSPLSRIQKAPEETLEVISRNLSEQLNTAIAALAVAIGNQAGALMTCPRLRMGVDLYVLQRTSAIVLP